MKVLMFSGGLDSYIAWYYLGKPKTVYVDLGHRYAQQELEVVSQLIPDTIIEKRLFMGDLEEPDANIPLRNAFLVLIGLLYGDEVFLVCQKGEMFIPDRSLEFFQNITSLASVLKQKECTISSVFPHMTKTEMVKWYLENGFPVEKLLQTRSCYSTTKRHCGRCSACFRRWVAFANNGIEEEYENPPWEWEKVDEYIEKMKKGMYDPKRTQETFEALKKVGRIR